VNPRLRVLPTGTGVKGLFLLTLLGLAFFATDYSNLFFLVIVFSIVLGAVGTWLAVRNLRDVTLTTLELPLAAASATRPVRVRLQAERAFDVAVEAKIDGRWRRLAHVPLVHGDREHVDELPGQPRGVRELDAIRITSRFPFGFVRVVRAVPLPATLATHPQPTTAEARSARRSGLGDLGDGTNRGAVVAGLRPFRTGDGLGDVHWRATARRGSPIVKEREAESAPAAILLVDRRADGDAFERVLGQACRRVLDARERGEALRLVSQGHAEPAAMTATALLHWLAAATPLPADAPPPPAIHHGPSSPPRHARIGARA
jgi:uncharacterized protein (DUF58 family)